MNRINWNVVIAYTVVVVAVIWACSHHQFVLPQRVLTVMGLIPWGALATIGVGYYAIKKAVQNYTEQKFWERRVEEYIKLVEAFGILLQEKHYETYDHLHAMSHKGVSDVFYTKRIENLSEKANDARDFYLSLCAGGSFLISETVIAKIKEASSVSSATEKIDYLDALSSDTKFFTECLKIVNAGAILDLDLNRKSKALRSKSDR